MAIEKLYLKNFRNFEGKLIEFSSGVTVIIGDNAVGKTNILEAIYLLATGKSFKARVEEETVGYSAEIARVKGIVSGIKYQVSGLETQETSDMTQDTKLEVVLTRGRIEVTEGKHERVARKRLLVNGVGKRLIDFAGNLKVVLFAPGDLDIVTESPGVRRKFLDAVLSLTDREYRRSLLSYEKGLRQRNKLLIRIREENLPRSQLLFWDKLLIKNGEYITKMREEFIEFVNSTDSLNSQEFEIEFDRSVISESRIEKYAKAEVSAGTTLVGPHRDDFVVKIRNPKSEIRRNLSSFGSRGEQRMGVLWLKLAELSFIEEKTKDKPTLLLDDIFSELDHEHKEVVMKVIEDRQTIITTADPHYIEGLKKVKQIKIDE